MQIAVPKETATGERRVAITPEVATRLIKEGWKVTVEPGAGSTAFFSDEAYLAVGVEVRSEGLLEQAQVVFTVQGLSESQIARLPAGCIVVGVLQPQRNLNRVEAMAKGYISSLALELVPRITRAQSMDVLSSQATVAGYVAALMAARISPRFLPMLTTAAGTIRPAKVLVMGVGVAGLQAIATARRLGANVFAYDVRKAAAEQALSLGAKVIELPISAEGEGGYARELTKEEQGLQQQALAEQVGSMDAVITTAQIPGRKAPILVTAEMVKGMKAGSVIVDMAAESGGNCELSQPGQAIEVGGVRIFAPLNLPSELAVHASEMYAKNLYNLSKLLVKEGRLEPDWSDEILAGALLTHQSEIVHLATREAMPNRPQPQPTPAEGGESYAQGDCMDSTWAALYIFLLAAFTGYEVISRVPVILHTPLMSGSNFIHGIVLVGAMVVLGKANTPLEQFIGFIAVILGAANAAGGYAVTERMLGMFERKPNVNRLTPRADGEKQDIKSK